MILSNGTFPILLCMILGNGQYAGQGPVPAPVGLPAQAGTYIPCLGYDRDDIYAMLKVYPSDKQL